MSHFSVLIANIGNSDLQVKAPVEINGRVLEKFFPKETFYEDSKYVYEHYEELKDKISFPILEGLLTYLRDRNEVLADIILFASEQESGHPQDTIYAAKVFERHRKYLVETASQQKNNKWGKLFHQLSKNQSKMITVDTNPADFDSMIEFYDQKFKKHPLLRDIAKDPKISRVYVSLTGGTQAMNTGLMNKSLQYFQLKTQFLYLANGYKEPYELASGRMLLKETFVQTLRDSVQIYDYYGAWCSLEQKADLFYHSGHVQALKKLLRFAHYRQSFDFQRAFDELDNFTMGSGHASFVNRVRQLRNEIHDFLENSLSAYMRELYWNAQMLYHRGQFIDYCGRLFRFQEEAMKQLLVKRLGVPFVEDGKKIDVSWVEAHPELQKFLEEYRVDKDRVGIKYHETVTRKTEIALLKYFTRHGYPELEEALKTFEILYNLGALRNQSPMAHGFTGISQHDLYNKLKGEIKDLQLEGVKDWLSQAMKVILKAVFPEDGEVEGQNVYDKMNILILEVLDCLD